MPTTTVTTKGQVVIPAQIRKRHNIQKGTRLIIEERGDDLVLRPLTREYFEAMAGTLQTKGRLSRALLRERAREKALEEKK